MANGTDAAAGGGIGGLTFVVLLILKLAGVIGMSWLGVITSIIWAPLLVVAAIFVVTGVVLLIIAGVAAIAGLLR